MKKRLGRQEWINAGLKGLMEQGVDSVRVERLAEALSVTKGSFYWHFRNRDDLLEALLEEWKKRATNDVIERVEQQGGDARERLHSLFSIVLESDGRLDMAIRAWASKDPKALEALKTIDKRRLSYLETLFKDLGFNPAEARARARLVYNAHVGQFAMSISAKPGGQQSKEWELVFEMLVRRNT